MTQTCVADLPRAFHARRKAGIPSIRTAHPLVIEAALLDEEERGGLVLIEANCNQVNQDDGYTGMTPIDYASSWRLSRAEWASVASG